MDKTLRSILWVLVALVVLSSFSTGWFFVAKERLYSDYVDLENLFKTTVERLDRELLSSKKESEDLKTKLAAAEKQLNTLEARNKGLSSKYEALLRDRDDLDKELVRVRKGKFYLEKKIKDVESDMFVAGILREKASLEMELGRFKDSLAPKDLKIEKLTSENTDLTARISGLKEEKDFLEQKIGDSEKVAEILSKDLLRERGKNEKDKGEFENVRMENSILKFKIAELQAAADKFDKLLAEKEKMGLKIASLEKDLEYRDREIDKIKTALMEKEKGQELRAEAYHSPQEVELPPIVLEREKYGVDRVGSAAGPSFGWGEKKSGSEGRIVTVNSKHNFVVIDLGRQHGVDIGTKFNVYRGDVLIGTLDVIQSRDKIAACDIKDVKQGFYVEIDDAVVKR